jgi:ribosome recycling factor
MNPYISQHQAEFDQTLDHFKKDIATLRTGRANPASLDGVTVEAYGSQSPINALANIAVVDPRCLTISPWDKSQTKALEKAVIEADLGFGVVNEGDKLRLTVPAMTEENRRELVKKLNERQEKAKVSVRQVREEIKSAIENAAHDKEIGEDDKFHHLKELDELVAKKNNDIKDIRDKKEKEIMEI